MFSLFNVDGKALLPIALAVLAAFGVYWLYTKSQSNQAATAEANANATALNAEGGGDTSELSQLATLSALFGGSTTGTAAPTLSTSQVTYTAPSGTPAAPSQAAPTTSGSATGNSTVNQV